MNALCTWMEDRWISDFEPVTAFQTARRYRLDAINGSDRLRDAILRAKGYAPPENPRRVVATPQLQPPVATLPKRTSPRLLIADIQQIVAAYYRVQPTSMTSADRRRRIVRARQVAMYLSCELTQHSIAEVGRRFNRDHTTVLHALKKVEEGMDDRKFNGDIALLRTKLEA
jgi:hypothetical protein